MPLYQAELGMLQFMNRQPIYSRTLDGNPHYDTNTEINISRYTCHKMCHKRDHEMFKYLSTRV